MSATEAQLGLEFEVELECALVSEVDFGWGTSCRVQVAESESKSVPEFSSVSELPSFRVRDRVRV